MPGNNWQAKLVWIVLAGGPPALVLWLSGLAGSHPLLVAVLIICYEAFLAALSFAGKVYRELEQRWLQRLVEFLDQLLRRWFSRFGRKYQEFVLNSLRYIDVKGLATIGYYTPELDDVFVDVSLTPRAPGQVATGLLVTLPPEVADRRKIKEFLDKPKPVVLAVVGAPGSGKTTLLRHTARTVYQRGGKRMRTVPMLVYLRDHVTAIVDDPGVSLPELLSGTLGQLRTAEPAGWFRVQLRRGHCVVLLDGLDEVARPNDRRVVADWVERLTREFPKNDYVITSRPQGYKDTPITGAVVLQVRPFTEEQVASFVRGWYRAVEKHSTGATGDQLKLIAEPLAEDLLERLRGAVALYDLTVNPLLLTMIANVHRYRGALPGSRTDLYGEICQVMLWRRLEAKKLQVELRGEKKEVLLRGLAFTMMQRRVRDLSGAEVLAELKPSLERMSRGLDAEEFVADISSNGLLVERESGHYSFAHLTFQEYLAATHIRDKGLTDELIAHVDDVWWRETTLLYAARSDADPLVRACLASNSITAMLLAFDCVDQASEVAPELRDRLDQLLDSAFVTGVGGERRRLMAGVLVARHLRKLVAVEDGSSRVCAEPITTALYWLFLQDNPARVPDGAMLIEPSVQRPVTGVRGSDALAFTAWANELVRGEVSFRLPTELEATAPAVRRVLDQGSARTRCLWLTSDDGGSEPTALLRDPDLHNYQTLPTTQFAQHITADIETHPYFLGRLLLLRTIAVMRLLSPALRIDADPDLPANRYLIHDLALVRMYTSAMRQHTDNPAVTLAYRLTAGLNLATAYTKGLIAVRSDDRDLTPEVLDQAVESWADPDLGPRDSFDDALSLDVDRVLSRRPRIPNNWGDLDDEEWTPHDTELILDRSTGAALSRTVGTTLRHASEEGSWSADFAHQFLALHKLDYQPRTASPDGLLESFGSSYGPRVLRIGRGEKSSWPYQVATRLQATALAVGRREEPVTPQVAAEIRIAALCLAVEADYQNDKELAALFRQIAVTVTLLRGRVMGWAPTPETIILATA